MLGRRELLRAGTLGGLVVAAPGLFAGCSDDASPPPKSAADGIRLVSSDVARDRRRPGSDRHGGRRGARARRRPVRRAPRHAENLAISPYSAAVALGMTVNGAVGATRDEMLEVLAAADTASLDDGLNGLTAYVESLAGPVPDMKRRRDLARRGQPAVRPGRDFAWQEPFLDALARSFGAGLREVDYVGATEEARTAINGWTAEQTHDRIPEIIAPGQ